MGKQALRYGTGLIALYLVVAHGSGFGAAITAGANGLGTVTRNLQGR
jgi:hypothetical protein